MDKLTPDTLRTVAIDLNRDWGDIIGEGWAIDVLACAEQWTSLQQRVEALGEQWEDMRVLLDEFHQEVQERWQDIDPVRHNERIVRLKQDIVALAAAQDKAGEE